MITNLVDVPPDPRALPLDLPLELVIEPRGDQALPCSGRCRRHARETARGGDRGGRGDRRRRPSPPVRAGPARPRGRHGAGRRRTDPGRRGRHRHRLAFADRHRAPHRRHPVLARRHHRGRLLVPGARRPRGGGHRRGAVHHRAGPARRIRTVADRAAVTAHTARFPVPPVRGPVRGARRGHRLHPSRPALPPRDRHHARADGRRPRRAEPLGGRQPEGLAGRGVHRRGRARLQSRRLAVPQAGMLSRHRRRSGPGADLRRTRRRPAAPARPSAGGGRGGESPMVAHMEDLTSSRAFRESSRRAFAQAASPSPTPTI